MAPYNSKANNFSTKNNFKATALAFFSFTVKEWKKVHSLHFVCFVPPQAILGNLNE